ncbi:MAG: hypothetical protein CMJ28_07165 [Phycisphaerae bacterium]|nr:hypothetical protein [Phycisphaerae bacterium]
MRLCDLLVVFFLTGVLEAADPVRLDDLGRLRSVSQITLDPSGGRAVAVVDGFSGIDPEAQKTRELWLIDLEDGLAPRPLTRSGRCSQPTFSPDGKSLYFLRDGNIWRLPMAGGESEALTESGDIGQFLCAPNGQSLVFVQPRPQLVAPTAEADPNGSAAQRRAWLRIQESSGRVRRFTGPEFVGEESLADKPVDRQLVRFDFEAKTSTVLTSAPGDYAEPRFLPGRDALVCTGRTDPEADPAIRRDRGLWRVPLDGSGAELLLQRSGTILSSPRPSGDGNLLAFTELDLSNESYSPLRLGVVGLGSIQDPPLWLTGPAGHDVRPSAIEWLTGRGTLWYTAAERGGFPLCSMGLGLLEPDRVVAERDRMPIGVHAFDVLATPGGSVLIWAETAWNDPCRIHVRDASGVRELWRPNAFLEDRALAKPERLTMTRPDELEVEGWLLDPPGRDPLATEGIPMVVEIHGGPSAMWGPGERTMWHEFQWLAGLGYAVAYANPRGSGGYGTEFRSANQKNWGPGPSGDVLAICDAALEKSWIDRERLFLTGGSYGGYLTAWTITQDHRFQAAVAQRGVYDLPVFYAEGRAWRLVETAYGDPSDPEINELLVRDSPVAQANAIKTPLLILHGDLDRRTGFVQSEMLYRSLERRGAPVELVRWSEANHNLSRTGPLIDRMDRLIRIADYFDRYDTLKRD